MSLIPGCAVSCAIPMHEPRFRSVGAEPFWPDRRFGSEEKTSSPSYQTYSPAIESVGCSGPGPPSIRARSPGYGRTRIGDTDEPARRLRNRPVYVPPRTQIESPGSTAAGAEKAVARFQGLPSVPVPLPVPDVPPTAT